MFPCPHCHLRLVRVTRGPVAAWECLAGHRHADPSLRCPVRTRPMADVAVERAGPVPPAVLCRPCQLVWLDPPDIRGEREILPDLRWALAVLKVNLIERRYGEEPDAGWKTWAGILETCVT